MGGRCTAGLGKLAITTFRTYYEVCRATASS